MVQSIISDININASVVETIANGYGTGKTNASLANDFPFGAGTGPNNAQAYWPVTSTVTAAIDTWTLSGLTDGLARTIAFTKIRGFLLWIPMGTNGQDLQLRWPTVAAPVSAPTVSASGADGTLATGNWIVSYTWTNANGETTRSPDTAPLAVTSGQHIGVTLPVLPTGATGANVYLSTLGGASATETRQNLAAVTGTSYTILALQAGPAFPTTNTCYYRGWTAIPPAGLSCKASGAIVLVAPLTAAYPVTASTADQIVLDPGANTITYKILAFGE
jgi:hypothetical protein